MLEHINRWLQNFNHLVVNGGMLLDCNIFVSKLKSRDEKYWTKKITEGIKKFEDKKYLESDSETILCYCIIGITIYNYYAREESNIFCIRKELVRSNENVLLYGNYIDKKKLYLDNGNYIFMKNILTQLISNFADEEKLVVEDVNTILTVDNVLMILIKTMLLCPILYSDETIVPNNKKIEVDSIIMTGIIKNMLAAQFKNMSAFILQSNIDYINKCKSDKELVDRFDGYQPITDLANSQIITLLGIKNLEIKVIDICGNNPHMKYGEMQEKMGEYLKSKKDTIITNIEKKLDKKIHAVYIKAVNLILENSDKDLGSVFLYYPSLSETKKLPNQSSAMWSKLINVDSLLHNTKLFESGELISEIADETKTYYNRLLKQTKFFIQEYNIIDLVGMRIENGYWAVLEIYNDDLVKKYNNTELNYIITNENKISISDTLINIFNIIMIFCITTSDDIIYGKDAVNSDPSNRLVFELYGKENTRGLYSCINRLKKTYKDEDSQEKINKALKYRCLSLLFTH